MKKWIKYSATFHSRLQSNSLESKLSETDRGHSTSDNSNHVQEEPTEDSISDKLTFNNEKVFVRMYDNPTRGVF